MADRIITLIAVALLAGCAPTDKTNHVQVLYLMDGTKCAVLDGGLLGGSIDCDWK